MGFEYGVILGLALTLQDLGTRTGVGSRKGGDLQMVAGIGLAFVGSRGCMVERR